MSEIDKFAKNKLSNPNVGRIAKKRVHIAESLYKKPLQFVRHRGNSDAYAGYLVPRKKRGLE